MIRTTIVIGAAVAALTLAGSASAQAPDEGQGKYRFGNARSFVVSADRLLPLLSYQSIKTTFNDGSTDTQSRFSLALMNSGPYGVFSSFYNLPRLGLDWFPIQNLSIGGAAWLYTDLQATDSSQPAGQSSKNTDMQKVTYWGVAPRVGYVIPMSEKLFLWPRAGVEYHHVSTNDIGNGSGSITQFAILAEAMLVISPWNHFGFTVGPTVDIPLSGSQTTVSPPPAAGGQPQSNKVDSAMFQVGLNAGMLGHF